VTLWRIRRSVLICLAVCVPLGIIGISGRNTPVFASTMEPQESGAGAPIGKLIVPAKVMAGYCVTMVSPTYPQQDSVQTAKRATVTVRVVIWKSGKVSPMRVISQQSPLNDEAMNVVRLWRYKPYSRAGVLVDVTTDVDVDFIPGKPGGIVTHPSS
jgi:protein TonB